MRGVATLDDFTHAGACALSRYNTKVGAPQLYYIDDVIVMNIIKGIKISQHALCAIIFQISGLTN